MAVTNDRSLKLTFLTSGGKSFVISVPQPRTNLTKEEVEAVMDTIIARNIFSTPSGELAAIRDIRVIDLSTDDLYDPPLT